MRRKERRFSDSEKYRERTLKKNLKKELKRTWNTGKVLQLKRIKSKYILHNGWASKYYMGKRYSIWPETSWSSYGRKNSSKSML